MADTIKTAKGVMGDNFNKVGTYKESTGGGTPLAKGEKLKDHPEAHRVQQPRDEDGQFTYNSANNKSLKYGPSRGFTIPPFLKGVKLNCLIKKDANGNDVAYAGGAKETISANSKTYIENMDMTMEDFLGKFKTLMKDGSLADVLGESSKKKGRRSAKESSFIQGGNKGVIEGTSEILSKYTVVDLKSKMNMYIANKKSVNINAIFKPKNIAKNITTGAMSSAGKTMANALFTNSGTSAPSGFTAIKATQNQNQGNKNTKASIQNRMSGLMSKLKAGKGQSSEDKKNSVLSRINASNLLNKYKK